METNCVKCCPAKKSVRKAKISGEKMATRFHEFSNEDIGRILENAVPATTKKQQISE